ncbi:hypothetical protein BJY59DRAFT_707347 [Rhodotorula toruloides]
MSLMPSTSSPTPAHAPPPPDERIPLSSMPDLTKFVPPLIQDAIENELDREDGGGYYDEFEQLYWTYSGWDEVREKFERDWDPLMDWVRDYSQRRFVAMGSMDRDAQKGLMMEYAELAPKFKFANLCRRGPAGLAILRRRYFDRNPVLDEKKRLTSLPSLRSRRDGWAQVAEGIRSTVQGLFGKSALEI